jgi:hypothetical protein
MKLNRVQFSMLLAVMLSACGINPYLGSSCDDGVDNDGDLRTDNEDPDCDNAVSDAEIVCPDAMGLCGLRCVDRQTDFKHCGHCDHVCDTQQACVEGACVAADGTTCTTPLILEQQLVTTPPSEVSEEVETRCEPPPYEHSTFYQVNIKKNSDDKLIIELGQEQDRVVYVYTDCRPIQLGCFEGSSAEVPDLNARFQNLYLEVNHRQEQLTSRPSVLLGTR